MVELSNEELAEVGKGFKEYLEEVFKGKEDKLEPIWNIDPQRIIPAQVNREPFRMNGYHPALLIHFSHFVKSFTGE
jgi:hypothetical protein